MKEPQQGPFRPFGRYLLIFGILYICFACLFICHIGEFEDNVSKIIWCVFCFFFFLVGVIATLLSELRWDAPVYIGTEAIVQKRPKRMICIQYDEIQNVKLLFFESHPGYVLRVYGKDGVITMRLNKCFECFMDHCTNQEILAKIKVQMDKRGLIR